MAALGAGRMPSRWFGGGLSRHCPEVKREISIFAVFDLCKQHKKLKILNKILYWYTKDETEY